MQSIGSHQRPFPIVLERMDLLSKSPRFDASDSILPDRASHVHVPAAAHPATPAA